MTTENQLAILNPAVRHDFVFIFEGINHNGNGDPDAENRPRQTDDGYAFTTPNSLLNRIYQTAADLYGVKIYATNDTNVTTVQSGYDTHMALMEHYWDRRLRGGLFTKTKDVKQGSIGKRGVIQIDTIESIQPVDEIVATTIVPSMQLDKEKENKVTGETDTVSEKTMGKLHHIPYAVYRGQGTYNAALNKKYGDLVTEQILAQFWMALWHHADHTRSLQRGGWHLRDVWVVTHPTPYGGSHHLIDIANMLEVSQGDRTFEVNPNWADGLEVNSLRDVYADLSAVASANLKQGVKP
jgi:CRISPR-associated protein Csd2